MMRQPASLARRGVTILALLGGALLDLIPVLAVAPVALAALIWLLAASHHSVAGNSTSSGSAEQLYQAPVYLADPAVTAEPTVPPIEPQSGRPAGPSSDRPAPTPKKIHRGRQ